MEKTKTLCLSILPSCNACCHLKPYGFVLPFCNGNQFLFFVTRIRCGKVVAMIAHNSDRLLFRKIMKHRYMCTICLVCKDISVQFHVLWNYVKQVWLWPQKAPCMCGQESVQYWCIYHLISSAPLLQLPRTREIVLCQCLQLYTLVWYCNLDVHLYSHYQSRNLFFDSF